MLGKDVLRLSLVLSHLHAPSWSGQPLSAPSFASGHCTEPPAVACDLPWNTSLRPVGTKSCLAVNATSDNPVCVCLAMGESCKSRSFKLTGYEREPASKQKTTYIYIYTLTNLLCNSKMEHSAVVFCLALWTSTQSTPAAVLWWNVSCDWAHFNLQMVFERNWGNVAKVRQDDLFTSSNGLRSGNLRLGSLPWCQRHGRVIPLLSLRFPKLRRRSKAQLKSRFLWGRYRLAEILDSLHFYVQRGTYASELVHSSPIRSSTGF